MTKDQKLLRHILPKKGDSNVSFDGLRHLLLRLDFEERTKGDHHIFTRVDLEEIINLQPNGPRAKVYQVRLVRELLLRQKFTLEE